MNLKKILIFAILGPWSILSAFQASAMRAHLQRYASTIIMSSIPSPRKADNYVSQLLRPRARLTRYAMCSKFKLDNFFTETSLVTPNTQLPSDEEILASEDKHAAELIKDLMAGNKKIYTVQQEASLLKAIASGYPEFYEAIANYKHSPKELVRLINTLKEFSKQGQLPHQLKAAFDAEQEKLNLLYAQSPMKYRMHTVQLYAKIS